MTEAYAIKGPDGEIIEIRLDGKEGLLREKWALQLARGYKCVPVTVSENTTPVCPNCGATSWADFYRGSSVIASVCKKCDHKITPPVTAVSEKGEAEALVVDIADLLKAGSSIEPTSTMHKRIDAYFSRRQG